MVALAALFETNTRTTSSLKRGCRACKQIPPKPHTQMEL